MNDDNLLPLLLKLDAKLDNLGSKLDKMDTTLNKIDITLNKQQENLDALAKEPKS